MWDQVVNVLFRSVEKGITYRLERQGRGLRIAMVRKALVKPPEEKKETEKKKKTPTKWGSCADSKGQVSPNPLQSFPLRVMHGIHKTKCPGTSYSHPL